jgi:ubiquinone/menaquinone biosynthesis C-methylase UbiE
MLDNRDRKHVTEQYAKLAANYDLRWSYYVRATTDATIQRLPNTLGDVLDVGCGTGALLSRLQTTQPVSQLTGVDASAEMLKIARNRLPAEITLRESWAEELPFDDCAFDTVVSCNMFHFIRRPHDALNEMFRVLRPGGMMVITDWCDDYLLCKLCDFYLRWFDPSHFCMYGTLQCHAMLESANACQVSVDKYKISTLWGLMTAKAYRSAASNTIETCNPLQYATQ